MGEDGVDGDVVTSHNCTMGPANPAPGYPMCVFPVNMDPVTGHGPFLTAEYAFFVPKEDLQRATNWMVQHRGVYDVLIHPNTGCHVQDHTDWAMWSGNKWELDTSVFPSSHGEEVGSGGVGEGGHGDDVYVITEESSVRTHGTATIKSNSTEQSSTEYSSSSSEENDEEWDEDEEEELDDESWTSVITVMVGVLGFIVLSLYAFASIMVSFIKMGNDRINDYEETPTTDDENADNNDVPNGGAILGGVDDVEGSLSSFRIGPVEEEDEDEEEEEEVHREII